MTAPKRARTRSRRTLHLAVTSAALAVVGCFTAAFTFAGSEAQASENPDTLIAAMR